MDWHANETVCAFTWEWEPSSSLVLAKYFGWHGCRRLLTLLLHHSLYSTSQHMSISLPPLSPSIPTPPSLPLFPPLHLPRHTFFSPLFLYPLCSSLPFALSLPLSLCPSPYILSLSPSLYLSQHSQCDVVSHVKCIRHRQYPRICLCISSLCISSHSQTSPCIVNFYLIWCARACVCVCGAGIQLFICVCVQYKCVCQCVCMCVCEYQLFFNSEALRGNLEMSSLK